MPEKNENSAKLIKQYKAGWVAGKRDAHLSYMRQIADRDAEIARLRDALNNLVKYSKIVNAKGASTGPQWIAFGDSIVHAEYALKGDEA